MNYEENTHINVAKTCFYRISRLQQKANRCIHTKNIYRIIWTQGWLVYLCILITDTRNSDKKRSDRGSDFQCPCRVNSQIYIKFLEITFTTNCN